MLADDLLSIFMEVYNDTVSNLTGCGADTNRQIEVLSGIQSAIGRKLCPYIGSLKSGPSRAVPSRGPQIPDTWDDDLLLSPRPNSIPQRVQQTQTQSRNNTTNVHMSHDTRWDLELSYAAVMEECDDPAISSTNTVAIPPPVSAHLSYETKTSANVSVPAPTQTPVLRMTKCSICLSDVDVTDNGPRGTHFITKCCHHFHNVCMDEMVKNYKNTPAPPGERKRPLKCPTCQTNL